MSVSIVREDAPRRVGTRATGIGRIDGLCRSLVLRRLAGVRGGRLTLVEPGGTQRLGCNQPDADGPAARLRVLDPRFYRSAVLGGALGVGESYMRGEWDADDLTAVFRLLIRNLGVSDGMGRGVAARVSGAGSRLAHAMRRNTRYGSRRNIAAHYDIGNDFYALMLDETMTYSSAVFERPEMTLAEAQRAKYDRLCRRLGLRPGDRVLEIGTGWGGLAEHAASRYGCQVTTTTISERQHAWARRRIDRAGLSDRVTLLKRDYRDLTGTYDKVISIEMIEAVGHENLATYFERCASLLEPGGAMALQAITMPDHRYERYRRSVDFIKRYIFPGCCVPSVGAMVSAAASSSDLRVVSVDDIGPHYARTLRAWRERVDAGRERVLAMGYPETFLRMWDYYLCYCEAGFAERYIGNVQMMVVKPGWRGTVELGSLSGDAGPDPAGAQG